MLLSTVSLMMPASCRATAVANPLHLHYNPYSCKRTPAAVTQLVHDLHQLETAHASDDAYLPI